MTPYESFLLIKNELSNLGSIFIVATIYIYIYLSINLYGYIYICVYIIYIYICIYIKQCAQRLSPQWLCGNSCTWAYDVWLHMAGTNEPKSAQKAMQGV